MYVSSEEIYGLCPVWQICFSRTVWIQLSDRAHLSYVSGILSWNKENCVCVDSLAPPVVCWTSKAGCWKFPGLLNHSARRSGEMVPRCSVSWEAEIPSHSSLLPLCLLCSVALWPHSTCSSSSCKGHRTGSSWECPHQEHCDTQSLCTISEALSTLISEQKMHQRILNPWQSSKAGELEGFLSNYFVYSLNCLGFLLLLSNLGILLKIFTKNPSKPLLRA